MKVGIIIEKRNMHIIRTALKKRIIGGSPTLGHGMLLNCKEAGQEGKEAWQESKRIRKMTIYIGPGADHWRHEMSKLPLPFPKLAEGMYIAGSNAELNNITRYELLEKESSIKHVLSTLQFHMSEFYYPCL